MHFPNGSGNNFSMNYCVTSIQRAIEAIKKGHVVKQDVMRIILDYDSEEEVARAQADPLKHVFYCELGVDLGFVAKIICNTSALMKQFLGPIAYFVTTWRLVAS